MEIDGDQWRSSRAEAVRCEPREGERERGSERVVTRDGGSGDDGARRVSG